MMDSNVPRSEEARSYGPAASGRARAGWLTRWLAGLLAGGFVWIAVSAEPSHRHLREKTYLKRTWGIEILFVRQTAAGRLLEFRYKVLDAEKAEPLFERRSKPVLTDTKTGAKLAVPTPAKTGALRNSNTPIAGRTYWMVFANPGGLVKQGNRVSIEIGEFRIDDLVVQ